MTAASELLNILPTTLTALQENPLASVVLISLSAFALVGYVLHKQR